MIDVIPRRRQYKNNIFKEFIKPTSLPLLVTVYEDHDKHIQLHHGSLAQLVGILPVNSDRIKLNGNIKKMDRLD